MSKFSNFLKAKRIEAGYGLREFARLIKMQPSNYCSIEAGSLVPPSDKLYAIASNLGIKKGSKEYHLFMDAASETRDEIPADVAKLIKSNSLIPAMLRTLEGEEVKPAQLKKIIEDIKSGRYKQKASS